MMKLKKHFRYEFLQLTWPYYAIIQEVISYKIRIVIIISFIEIVDA